MGAQAGTIDTMDPDANELVVRAATSEDAEGCAQIFYDAFESIASRHSFPVEPGSPDLS